MLEHAGPQSVWDLGANTGAFSSIAAGQGAYTIAFDGDRGIAETMQQWLGLSPFALVPRMAS